MRKQLKIKRRSCGLCNPNKKGWQCRWTPQEKQLLAEFDHVRRNLLGASR